MGPFGCPWSTFSAYIISALSVVGAIVWALRKHKTER